MDGTLEGDTVDLTLFFTWLPVDLVQLAFSPSRFFRLLNIDDD